MTLGSGIWRLDKGQRPLDLSPHEIEAHLAGILNRDMTW